MFRNTEKNWDLGLQYIAVLCRLSQAENVFTYMYNHFNKNYSSKAIFITAIQYILFTK